MVECTRFGKYSPGNRDYDLSDLVTARTGDF